MEADEKHPEISTSDDASHPRQDGERRKCRIGIVYSDDLEGGNGSPILGKNGRFRCRKVADLLLRDKGGIDHIVILGGPDICCGNAKISLRTIFGNVLANRLGEFDLGPDQISKKVEVQLDGQGLLGRDLVATDTYLRKAGSTLTYQSNMVGVALVFIGSERDWRLAQKVAHHMTSTTGFEFCSSGELETAWWSGTPVNRLAHALKGAIGHWLDPTLSKYRWMRRWAEREITHRREALEASLK